jgi:hypothetical protein
MSGKLLFAFVLLMRISCFSQRLDGDNCGVQLQALISIGTHQTSVGLRLSSYVNFSYAQINLGTMYRFHAQNFGGRRNFGEWRHYTGLVLMAGPETNPVNFRWDAAFHQTARPYSVGLGQLWYVDKTGTSQRSGIMSLGIKRVDIVFENDIFAGQGRDKFRTGDFQISYRDSSQLVSVGVRLWTGETRNSVWDRTPAPGMPGGYRDLSALPYGKTSAGLLFISGRKQFAADQSVNIEAGFDSEEVRYIFQNRVSHDLVLLPKKVTRHTPHYPRLDSLGMPVFTRKEQRKSLPVFRIGLNDISTY